MRKRKLVCGVGINDADYVVQQLVDGKHVVCVFYSTWKSMLRRCYSAKSQAIHTTYVGCSVCDEWLTFSNFKKWMGAQDFEGKELDKDIIVSGNKVYSPDACVFVTQSVNSLLTDHGAARGKYKQGVCWNKRDKIFTAQFMVRGKLKYLGRYDTEQEAYAAYVAAKSAHIREVADTQEPRVKAGLYRHATELENTLKTED